MIMETYIFRRHNTVMQYIATQSILGFSGQWEVLGKDMDGDRDESNKSEGVKKGADVRLGDAEKDRNMGEQRRG